MLPASLDRMVGSPFSEWNTLKRMIYTNFIAYFIKELHICIAFFNAVVLLAGWILEKSILRKEIMW